MRQNMVNRIIQILLQLADLADEKKESPFDKELGLGYRAFSSYVREGVIQIINLQDDYSRSKENEEYAKKLYEEDMKGLEKLFGRTDPFDFYTEDELARIKTVAEEITAENAKELMNDLALAKERGEE